MENIVSANAWEADAELRSSASGASSLYDVHLAAQNSMSYQT